MCQRRISHIVPAISTPKIAIAMKADRCDIYTDVDGVYTTDPRVVPKAHRLDRISYEEMLEMASQGAKVLQTRSVELAMQKGVRVLVRSSSHNLGFCSSGPVYSLVSVI